MQKIMRFGAILALIRSDSLPFRSKTPGQLFQPASRRAYNRNFLAKNRIFTAKRVVHGMLVHRLTRKHHEGAHHLRWGFFVVLFYWPDGRKSGEHMIIVNGEQVEFVENSTVTDLVAALGLERSRVAVELNGNIVSRATFDDTLLHDDDKVEIVHFVGGG